MSFIENAPDRTLDASQRVLSMAAPTLVPSRNVRIRLFQGLTEPEITRIVSAARPTQYLTGSVVYNQGHPAEHLYLLTHGRARHFFITPDGRKIALIWIPAGGIMGGAALLPHTVEYLVSTEALKPCSVLVWDRKTIRALAVRFPQLLENVMMTAFDYLVAYRAAHISMAFHSAPQRLAQVLANLAAGIGERTMAGIELDVRNEELATEANVTVFTTSRLLQEWQRQGILKKKRGKIVLITPHRLFAVPSETE
jgi:CRP-like cAMP-binding protein